MAAIRSTRPPPSEPTGNGPAPAPARSDAAPSPMPPTSPDIRRAYLDHLCFVMSLARSLGVRRQVDCEDVAHEVFAIAWEQLDRYDPTKGTLRAWLASIAIHKAKRWRRLARNRLDHGADPDEREDPSHGAEQHTADAQLRAIARQLAEELPEELRWPLELIEFHELTHQEAADALGLPLSTLSTRFYKARQEYQKKIDRLRARKQFTIDDLRGVAIPIPAGIGEMYDALRTSDLAVDGRAADQLWERVLSEPADSGAAPPDAPASPAPTTQSPRSPAETSGPVVPAGGAAAAGAAAPSAVRMLATGGAITGGAKIGGAVLALVAAAAGGAALQATIASDKPPPVVSAAADMTSAPSTAAAPSASTATASSTVANAPTSTVAPTSSPSTNESDANLMDRMRAALASRPGEVIALAGKHARLYPSKNVQEREALTILALARTGQRADAQSRAKAFRAKYPRSAYVMIMESELGGSGP